MTLSLNRTLKHVSAGLMLALALVYLMHSAWHAGLAEVTMPPGGAAVALQLDPFVLAEGQSGDGVAGCHFFCNHGCPVPPLPDLPRLLEAPQVQIYGAEPTRSARCAHPQPIKAPPRKLS
ncbi:MAG: hypothetical protein IPP58_09440 [Holophagaceae bacterium]|uniref:DUF2946 domain-containing protein n=1 Tax=Candidatus Geothrix skivensis TaxID=2954439 RepID=A0A9D7SFX9_9BACT|nr:hypothetical protein [Candidatus Geothrix skivensis]